MRKIIGLLAILFAAQQMQAQALESKALYNKVEQTAVAAEYAYDIDIVEAAIEQDLKQRGFGKGKSSKGYSLYQGISFLEIASDKIDFYIKAEKKSKKEKDKTIITVLVSKGYDNFVNGTTDPKIIQAAINYINNLKVKFDSGNLELQIKEQEDVIKKEDKKYNNLIDDASDLEKKKRKIEEDIVNNKKNQDTQKAEVEKQRQILESLKAQRKN
jgi:hypothetical protein